MRVCSEGVKWRVTLGALAARGGVCASVLDLGERTVADKEDSSRVDLRLRRSYLVCWNMMR